MPRCAQFTKRTRAVTLLEVMMAAALIASAFVGMMQVVVSGSNMLDMSRKQTIATQIIHAEIDAMRLESWTTIYNLIGTSATMNLGALVSTDIPTTWPYDRFGYPELMTFKNIAANFTAVRVVALVSGRTDMVTITFTVTWQSNMLSGSGAARTGKTFSRTGTTYFSKSGLFTSYQKS